MKIVINTDGGCRTNSAETPGKAAGAFVAQVDTGRYLASQAEVFEGTNNYAEYRGVQLAVLALPVLMRRFRDLPTPWTVEFRSDSQLIVNQLNGNWAIKKDNIKPLAIAIMQLLRAGGYQYSFVWVPREQNKDADRLCNLAMDGDVKRDLFTALPPPKSRAQITCGQMFARDGELTSPRPMRVDREGYALCNGCGNRLKACTCPSLKEESCGVQFGVEFEEVAGTGTDG